MIKLLPLVIIPTLFLIFFLNVGNLTSNFDNDSKVGVIENNDVSEEFNNNNGIELKKIKDSEVSTTSKSKEVDDSSINNLESESSDENNAEETLLNKDLKKTSLEKNNRVPEVKPKPDQLKSKKKLVKIQFGAFSKIKNAEDQKKKITELLSDKFPEFGKKFNILEENRLFKLIYVSNNSLIAKSICDYSKSKKISCLILKK